ncbi:hypothetical protein POUND7_020326 [Theobroma cacao]
MSSEGISEEEIKEGNDREKLNGAEANIQGFRPAPLDVLDHVKINCQPETPISTLKGVIKSSKLNLSFSRQELRKREEKITQAFVEFYRKLRLLKTYCFLNQLAFFKIMKKYDKCRSHRGMHERLTYKWWMNLILAALMRLVSLWKGWRPPMLNILLMEITEKEWKTLRPQVKKERHRITFLYGFFSGCSIALIVSIIVNIHARDLLRSQGRHQYVVNIFLLYSLFVYIGLHMLMYSGNIFSWKRYRVNFSFIFGFKQRTELGYREVLLSTTLSLLALAGAISHLDMEIDPRTKSFTVLTELIPLVLLLAVLSIMFCPFNIIYRSSRFFLIKCAFYSVCAPLDKVTLLDFFLADQLTSQCLRRLFEEKRAANGLNGLK